MVAILDSQLARTGGHVVGASFTLADIPIGLSVNRWFMTPFESTRVSPCRGLLRAAERAAGFPQAWP